MPGYSGTPLPKKLGIKDGFRASLVNAPTDVLKELKSALARCEVLDGDAQELDFVVIFTKSRSDLKSKFEPAAKSLTSAGMLWIGWPKRSSGVVTDLNENVVRETGLNGGLVDVKVCAITEVWSGLKFVRRLKDR